jgi:hypothetical protein
MITDEARESSLNKNLHSQRQAGRRQHKQVEYFGGDNQSKNTNILLTIFLRRKK